MFGAGRLDSLDRQVLEVVCGHGREGQSFNKLIAEMRPFASRSTSVLRVKRLERLKYAERFPDRNNKQVVRLRGTPTTLLVTRIASRMKAQCAELGQTIHKRAESVKKLNAIGEDEINRGLKFANQTNDKIKGIFSLVGIYAVMMGETVAGDFLLPLVIDDFRKLDSGYMELLASNPQLMHVLADKKLAGIPLGQVEDDFKYAFGIEMSKALPRFSQHLSSLSKPATTEHSHS